MEAPKRVVERIRKEIELLFLGGGGGVAVVILDLESSWVCDENGRRGRVSGKIANE